MAQSIQQPLLRQGYRLYMVLFFIFLAAPLIAAGVFAFNDSLFPVLPWRGFTLDWFFNDTEPKLGMFHDRRLLRGLYYSFVIASIVSILAVFVGTCNAFLFVRHDFPAKNFFYILMVLPLVIPGVILGISILAMASNLANSVERSMGIDLELLRPGILLVVLGQFSFITTITSLIITARLKKFDQTMEEAAFENFNTTLFLVGSEAPLTITMYDRMVKVGSTPVLNAVSFFLMLGSALLALVSVLVQRDKQP